MLTFYHSPKSRSTSVLALVEEMGIGDRITRVDVTIPRQDGSGGRDPGNPHPAGKVPALDHDGTLITERGAVMLTLTDQFPGSGLAPEPGTPQRGAFLTWLFWYHAVMEPVVIHDYVGLTDNPVLQATFRGPAEMAARLRAALERGSYLLGETFSAADILCHSPFAWFPDITPDDPLIRAWVDRCKARPGAVRAREIDAALLAG